MWITSIVPEWLLHVSLFVGFLGLILSFFPLVDRYKAPMLLVSFVIFSAGLYFEGRLAEYKIWKHRVGELEKIIEDLSAKSEKVNTEIVTKVITKNRIIKEKGDEVIKYIDREVVKYDNTCPVPQEVVNAINAAAQNKSVEEIK